MRSYEITNSRTCLPSQQKFDDPTKSPPDDQHDSSAVEDYTGIIKTTVARRLGRLVQSSKRGSKSTESLSVAPTKMSANARPREPLIPRSPTVEMSFGEDYSDIGEPISTEQAVGQRQPAASCRSKRGQSSFTMTEATLDRLSRRLESLNTDLHKKQAVFNRALITRNRIISKQNQLICQLLVATATSMEVEEESDVNDSNIGIDSQLVERCLTALSRPEASSSVVAIDPLTLNSHAASRPEAKGLLEDIVDKTNSVTPHKDESQSIRDETNRHCHTTRITISHGDWLAPETKSSTIDEKNFEQTSTTDETDSAVVDLTSLVSMSSSSSSSTTPYSSPNSSFSDKSEPPRRPSQRDAMRVNGRPDRLQTDPWFKPLPMAAVHIPIQ